MTQFNPKRPEAWPRGGQHGAVLFIVVMLLPVLISFMALAIDVGYLYSVKRKLQTVADAAALACAHQMQRAQPCTYQNGANNAGALDVPAFYGIDWSDVNTSQPAANQVQVQVSQNTPTFFLKIISINSVNIIATARAEMRPNCVTTLDPSATSSLLTGVGANLQMPDCGIFVHSNHASAFNATAGSTVNALSIDIVGNRTGTGSVTPTPMVTVSGIGDPLTALPDMTPGACDHINLTVKSSTTLYPGVYCGGIRISLKPTVTFSPGIYYLVGGGLNTGFGYSSIVGTGVTFFNTQSLPVYPYGPILIGVVNGNSFQLTAPTSGAYKGILFYQDRKVASGATSVFGGGANQALQLTGTLYFPTTNVAYQSQSTAVAGSYTTIIAKNVLFSGASRLNYQAGASWAPVSGPVRLVQ
jgi:Flp pilus assembly protein TadG